nr:ATP-binding protein [uncultured Cohaesibacter sp.]
MSLTDLIRQSNDPEKSAALIEALHFAASNAMAMVESGTELFKQPRQDKILLGDWLKEFEGLANILANFHQANFTLKISSELEAADPIAPEPSYLHRILMLLLDNALKYTQGATITLTAVLKSSTEILLTLCDNGPGFQKENPELLFEPYHRGEGKGATDGKGLGLWSARHILSAMGGSIIAKENDPHGACFLMTLPLEAPTDPLGSEADASEQTRQPAPPENARKTKTEILIVDDNKTNLLIMTEILKAMDFCPIAAQSGTEALQLLEDTSPDAGIFDIQMEDMSGWQLMRQIEQNASSKSKALPAIAVSADDAPETIAPFKAWLRRPIQPEELYEIIVHCLAESKSVHL